MSYETKLTSGNEADHNQGTMREVKVKTATERDKTPRPSRGKRTIVSLAPVYEAAVRYGTAGKGAAWGRAAGPYVVVTPLSVRG